MSFESLCSRCFGVVICFGVFVPMAAHPDGRFGDARLLVGKHQILGSLVSDVNAKQIGFDADGTLSFQVPFEKIRSLVYERTSKPRYAAAVLIAWPLLFTKSKQHYLTIQYTDAAGVGKFQILRLDKDNVQAVLNTIEADTAITIERTEER